MEASTAEAPSRPKKKPAATKPKAMARVLLPSGESYDVQQGFSTVRRYLETAKAENTMAVFSIDERTRVSVQPEGVHVLELNRS